MLAVALAETSGEEEEETLTEVQAELLEEDDTDGDEDKEEEVDTEDVGVLVNEIRDDRDDVTLCLLDELPLGETVSVTAKGVRESVFD